MGDDEPDYLGPRKRLRRRSKQYYRDLRSRYEPRQIRLIVVAESPPASGKYIYDKAGKASEPLFSALMTSIRTDAPNKASGLRELMRRGIVVVDAIYEPVNSLSDDARDAKLVAAFPDLLSDIGDLIGTKAVPVVLIKANVCRLLEGPLRANGLNVINGGTVIYFPSSGRQPDFRRQFTEVLERARLSF
jgi:hypothetical protein